MKLSQILWEENVGGLDLVARSLVGSVGIIALAMNLLPDGIVTWAVALVTFVGLFSGMTKHCSPYGLIGFSTAKKSRK